jgi:F-type H+-transporting ATPase subunit gamma
MAKARALDKRRKSIRNIRKITRTMEMIATARFKKAMDRAVAATDFTRRVTQLVRDLSQGGGSAAPAAGATEEVRSMPSC